MEERPLLPSAQSEGELSVNYLSLYNDEEDDVPDENDDDGSLQISDRTKRVDNRTNILPMATIAAILSTAFSYGCVFTTLFLITLPIECQRLNKEHPNIPKSVALGIFVAVAGGTQLVTPLVGRLSDTYIPPKPHELGQRLPYLVLGALLTVAGLCGQLLASYVGFWWRYSVAFFLHMTGLNIIYAMMIALIPDQVPPAQTGVANGALALLLVTGSLTGFGLYQTVLSDHIQYMYMLYIGIVVATTALTCAFAHEKDAAVAYERNRRRYKRREASVRRMQSPPELLGKQHRNSKQQQQWHQKATKIVTKAAVRVARGAKDIVLTPTLLIKTLVLDPMRKLNRETLWQAYTIDRTKYHDFFVVTISRLFYYCGMSGQTFFLYFLHDAIGIRVHPERAVATLSILGQCSAAVVCYPVGILSDRYFHGQRKPFVLLACGLLCGTMLSIMLFAQTWDQMVVFSLVLGAANGIYLTMDTSLAVDSLPHESDVNDDNAEKEDNEEATEDAHAQLLGIWGVAAFLGSALGPMIGGPVLYYVGSTTTTGNDANASDELDSTREMYSKAGYSILLSLSAFYFLCSAISLHYLNRRETTTSS